MSIKLKSSCFSFILILFFINEITSERVKRIVGGNPASSPPPPGLINFIDENYPGNVPSSTTPPPPEPDFEDSSDAIVFPRRGARRAQVNGIKERDNYYSFKGMKYAKAPEGRLRFQVIMF